MLEIEKEETAETQEIVAVSLGHTFVNRGLPGIVVNFHLAFQPTAGLPLAARIVAWHNGRINICDSPLGGARFTITWPGFAQESVISEDLDSQIAGEKA